MWEKEIGEVKKTFLPELRSLIRIDTEYDAGSVSAKCPYGRNIAAGLDYIRRKAVQDGFDLLEYDGRALAVSLGNQPGRVEAVSHIDVVPAGGGWTFPPYGAAVVGQRLYGRGTQDMKTPLWITYTALRMIRNSGVPLKRQIRVVVGTDEERSMQDMVYYLGKAGLPDFAFTPDGSFPLCAGEKGVVVWHLDRPVTTVVRAFRAGSVSNVICGLAVFSVPLEHYGALKKALDLKRCSYDAVLAGEATVSVRGKSAHSSDPQAGDNAIVKALEGIAAAYREPWAVQLARAFRDPYGSGLGLSGDYPPMGFASAELNILTIRDGNLHGEIDVRFPSPLTSSALTEKARNALPLFRVSQVYEEPVLSADLSSPYVRALLANYRSFFPEDAAEPYIGGGVTYSKVYGGRCVAYGARYPFQSTPNLAHQADEYVSLRRIYDSCRLYAGALTALANCEVRES